MSCKAEPQISHDVELPQAPIYQSTFEIERIGIMDTVTVMINGEIINLNNSAELPRAKVELTSKYNSYFQICQSKGEFTFEHIPHGKYIARIDYEGYKTIIDSIEFKSGEIVKLKIGMVNE